MPTYKVLLEYSHTFIYVLTMTAFTWQMTLWQSLKCLLFRLLQEMLLTPAQVDCTSLSFYPSNIHLLVYIL